MKAGPGFKTSTAGQNKAHLGKVSVGRPYIRFKKLEDLNLPVALGLVKQASGLLAKLGGSFMIQGSASSPVIPRTSSPVARQ